MTIAELISDGFVNGLPYPGDSENPPTLVRLPLFRMAGMPQDIADQVENTVKMIGEAVVNLIETTGESVIVPKTEYEALKAKGESE